MKSKELETMERKLASLKKRVKGLEGLVKTVARLENKADMYDGLSLADDAALSAATNMFYRRLEVLTIGLS